jgi:hypothetical protein
VPLRLLARAAPFVLGAIAAALWLRGRQPERPALPVRTGPTLPERTEPDPPVSSAPARGGRVERRSRSGRFDRPRAGRFDRPQTGRFARSSERRPIDIVAVVDDLLGLPH